MSYYNLTSLRRFECTVRGEEFEETIILYADDIIQALRMWNDRWMSNHQPVDAFKLAVDEVMD